MTFSAFNNELKATHQVVAWRFVPSAFALKVGQSITRPPATKEARGHR